MNFKRKMQSYFKLLTLDERKREIQKTLFQLEKTPKRRSNPVISLNMADAIVEYCLLIDNNDERLLQYNRALELVHNARRISKKFKLIEQLLRSYHLECFIKYHTMRYKDEEASIQDILNLSGKIIEVAKHVQRTNSYIHCEGYNSLGHVWRAYGLLLELIHKYKELRPSQKRDILVKARELVDKARELRRNTKNRDAHILYAYMSAFVEELPQRMLYGDKATTEKDFIEFMCPYDILFEVARAYGSIEFEYLALLNRVRLNLGRIHYAVGVSEKKGEIFNLILEDCKKLEEYENMIHLPHLHFFRYEIQTKVYTSLIYFEAVKEERFNYCISKAINSAEKMKEIYVSSKMKSARDKVEMYHILNEVYMMKASSIASRAEKLDYLKRSEELLLEAEKSSATLSPQVYINWRDLSSIYLELSKVERNQIYFKNCVLYAKKAYDSALETDEFKNALFEAYKIALIGEDYQDYTLSMKYYEEAHQLINEIILAGKDYPYYYNLKTYLKARSLGVKAKEFHSKGKYEHAMSFYRKANSLLQQHDLYSYEGLLYSIYALFEEASIRFMEEKYEKTLEILSNIKRSFDETARHYPEDYKPQFHYFIDRSAYDLQQVFFESSKTFCIAQSNILQSLIYRNTGNSEKAITLLKEANNLLVPFIDQNIHIAGYYYFANGLYGLEKSELTINDGDYKGAASYLASASDQFENASYVLASDKRLNQLCEGLMFFCQGWMYALEIRRRDIDLDPSELNANFALAHQSFANATKSLKMFKKTSNSVFGFEKLVSYIYYSLLLQKTDVPTKKSEFKDKIVAVLDEAHHYFKEAEDMERYEFVRDLFAVLPRLEIADEKIFKPIAIPFTPYTPVLDTTTNVEPSGANFVISLDKNQVEVNEVIRYSIQITSETSFHVKQIDGVLPKKNVKVVSEKHLAKNGTVEINRFLSPSNPIEIEVKIQASKPFYKRIHPRLIYLNKKNEKCQAFASPLTLQVYPKSVLKSGVVNEVNEKVNLVVEIIEELGITLGEFPIIFHDINSYRETLAEYYFRYEIDANGKKHHSKKTDISEIPIQQMAFVDPLGEVNILYDLETYLYPQSIANLLSIIIHEKFGHGFFHQFTILGKKLLELEYHHKGIELLMKELEKISNKYATGIQWLCVSTLVADEGFATWLELKTFEKLLEISDLDPKFIQQVRHEIDNFKKMVFESEELNVQHEYFTLKYEKPVVNPYALGYDLFSQIEKKYGEKCVPKALEIAANVSLTRRQISLMPNMIKNDKNCADKRLEKIACSDLKIERNNITMFEKAAKKLFL
ncbi:MAG: hypothetical protein ACFFCD_02080 [Promethearchaeota archaeon]